jgi:hypothetical protein
MTAADELSIQQDRRYAAPKTDFPINRHHRNALAVMLRKLRIAIHVHKTHAVSMPAAALADDALSFFAQVAAPTRVNHDDFALDGGRYSSKPSPEHGDRPRCDTFPF